MTMKNDAIFEELTCCFKIDMMNLTHFYWNTQKSQIIALWPREVRERLYLMVLNIDAKFEGKPTFAFKNDMRNLANFHRLKAILF